jgi:hypothetical protein
VLRSTWFGVCEGAFGSLAKLWRETGQERPSRHGRGRGGEIAKVFPAVHADSMAANADISNSSADPRPMVASPFVVA